jgi:hypothetical protein
MKRILTVAPILMLLILWSGVAPAAGPLPGSKAGAFSYEPSANASRQSKPAKPTTPGVVAQAAFADLAVTEIAVRDVGQGALIQVTVKNLGTASADATLYKLRVLLDGSPLQERDQPLFNERSPIRPNQVRVTGFIPTQAGHIEVTARLVPEGAAVADRAANNILTRTLDIPEVRPDFIITDLSLRQDNRIQVTIRNGGGHAPREAVIGLEVLAGNDNLRYSGAGRWPTPRETTVVTTSDSIVGTRRVQATINPNRSVLEMNYENNVLSKEFTAHVLKPDLAVTAVAYWAEPDYRLLINIGNFGEAASPRIIHYEVFGDDQSINTYAINGSIASHSSKTIETGIPVVRGREYRVTVDPRNEIDEKREDNNSRTATPLPERRR